MKILFLLLVLIGCSTHRVVVERNLPPSLTIPKGATVEVQKVTGVKTFQFNLNQALLEQGQLQVVHSLQREELIDGILRRDRNKEDYPQADYFIRGHAQEEIEVRRGKNGTVQFAGISRPFLQLVNAKTGEILISKYFVGTSLSQPYQSHSNTGYDGQTDAINSARRVAIEDFLSMFTSQKDWMEIDLLPFDDMQKFNETKNLMSYGQLEEAKKVVNNYLGTASLKESNKGKALFSLAVIESLLGNLKQAENIIIESNRLFPNEKTVEYLDQIKKMKAQRNLI